MRTKFDQGQFQCIIRQSTGALVCFDEAGEASVRLMVRAEAEGEGER